MGETLCVALEGTREWAEAHVGDVLAARAAFDARNVTAAPLDPASPVK